VPALIFDCDGVLADTERDGHRPAFNETFAEAGLPVRWSEEEYGVKLRIGGGKERMASLLTDDFVRANGLPADAEALPAEPKIRRCSSAIAFTRSRTCESSDGGSFFFGLLSRYSRCAST